MLRVKNVCKSYVSGKLVQHALDDVSLNLRDNEFVAILGPSGSGKTTLLNIIGGLDHYDSGDLVIDGISTKKYRDRDWDSYRNHSIGFVFQSYNLIPHQTILANVELALTISGIHPHERKRRAQDALAKVGLADHMHKRPDQLSGGQMQRVAIARALVNNPKILLADEPTGALDSDTGIQVMELLREVAADRLVVMVTHNPELAQNYATRIISLRDGKIHSDTHPLDDAALPPDTSVSAGMGKSGMSFFTALSLSFNNLLTKKARTFLTSFAGSIGIIGIALILAASAGVNEYIASEQESMLYAYPVQILRTSFDLTQFLDITGMTSTVEDDGNDDINVVETLTRLFSNVGANDLKSLKTFLESGESDIYDHVNSIQYSYDVTPLIWTEENGTYRQVNPDDTLSGISAGILSSSASPLSSLFETDVFFQLPTDDNVYADKYECVAGHWPESANECVVVLTSDGNISDTMMYALGLRDSLELKDMVSEFLNGDTVNMPEEFGTYYYDDILGKTFKLIHPEECYQYDAGYGVWTDMTDDDAYMQALASQGAELKIAGIARSVEPSQNSLLDSGIYYTSDLVEQIIADAAESEIVKSQLENPDINVFTGEPFGSDEGAGSLDIASLFNIDEQTIADAFNFDISEIEQKIAGSLDLSQLTGIDASSIDTGSIDLSGMLDFSNMSISNDAMADSLDFDDILKNVKISVSEDTITQLATQLLDGYNAWAPTNPGDTLAGLFDGFAQYLASDGARQILVSDITDIISQAGAVTLPVEKLQELATSLMTGFQTFIDNNGYTDIALAAQYFNEYIQSQDAQDIISSWMSENINIPSGISITQEQVEKIITDLTAGYATYAQESGLPTAQNIGESFLAYLQTDDAQSIMGQTIGNIVDLGDVQTQITSTISSYAQQMADSIGTQLQSQLTPVVSSLMEEITFQLTSGMEDAMSKLADSLESSLTDAFSIDTAGLADSLIPNVDVSQLSEILTSLTSAGGATYEDNLSTLGYAEFDNPESISIYPKDFEDKDRVMAILDGYNERMTAEGKDEQVISYSDTTQTLMSSVTDMISIITAVMIAVVSISLIVSSIMIGVITYISVMERRKEIGILRALGASKRNVSEVFNAETVIIGAASGLMGVVVAYILTFPINMVIQNYTNLDNVRIFLPFVYALMLVAISIALTLISGFIPSMKAAKSDPVKALRSE